jgi:hypothetical protein
MGADHTIAFWSCGFFNNAPPELGCEGTGELSS